MLKLSLVGVVCICAILMLACSGEKKTESQMDVTTETQVAVTDTSSQATCPACDMTMDKTEMVTHVADGDTIHFCSEGCQKHYLAQQEKKPSEQ